MRTRALLYIVLGFVILTALVVVDLFAHSYRTIQGMGFQIVRSAIQGLALLIFVRGAQRFFRRGQDVSRKDDPASAPWWPVKLVQRFAAVLGIAVALSALPEVLRIAFSERYGPGSFGAVTTIGLLGSLWLFVQVFLVLAFAQLLFVRQNTRKNSKRINWWVASVLTISTFFFLREQNVLGVNMFSVVLLTILSLAVVVTSLPLGYRLPWLPYLARKDRRTLLTFSAINIILGVAGFLILTNPTKSTFIYNYYATYWHTTVVALLATTTIYFFLVFFSTLFSFSSSDLVERKSAEVKSLARLTRFSSDVLTSELLLDLPKLADQITTLASEAADADAAWLELRTTFGAGERVNEDLIRSFVGIDSESAEEIMARASGFPEAGKSIGSPRSELTTARRGFIMRKRVSAIEQLPGPASRARYHSLLAVPLIRQGEVRGGLYVAKRREDGFDEDDLTILEAFSDVASLALETGRLLADSIEKQKFDGELRAARSMHKSLLPERFPHIPNFDINAISVPAYDVGGDYYDFSVLWDGAPVIVIGDVSGKGISAALYMAETKGVVQALTPIMSNMPELLEGANSALLRNAPQQALFRRSFVTLGMLSFRSDGIRYCRAGHTPLLIVRANGEFEYVQPKGMAVGLMRQTIFNQMLEQREIHVQKDDLVILFSDGITDTRNADNEELGYELFARLVVQHRCAGSAKVITEKVLEDVIQYSATSTFGDDATIVVLRCTQTPGSSQTLAHNG